MWRRQPWPNYSGFAMMNDLSPRQDGQPASRAAGLERLAAFLPHAAGEYARRRNFDLGWQDRSNVSMMSPYLRYRLVSEAEVVQAVLERHSARDADKFIQEVFWRGYFKGWLEAHPSVWLDFQADIRRLTRELSEDVALARRWRRAVEGRTGIECFDAWARELIETGYLHNHARMWFASIWIFTLGLPWQLGADFFLRHLVDGDPASNTLSWRWVGGLHTRGKTYLAEPENIETFTGGRLANVTGLAAAAPALGELRAHEPQPLREAFEKAPEGRCVLLITEEDCSSEAFMDGCEPVEVVAFAMAAARSPMPVAQSVVQFVRGAIGDAARRATEAFGCTVSIVDEPDRLAEVLIEACRRRAVGRVVSAYAPTGPAASLIGQAGERLAAAGIEVCLVRRAYDDAVWPHARRGFFKLKAKIPQILDQLGIERSA
jgi:deoxyribodipyrimidine photo-lyase